MAWLMARKAVCAGQITGEEASRLYRLGTNDFCLNHNKDISDIVPFYMSNLLKRSHMIYERVWRLDKQIYERELGSIH